MTEDGRRIRRAAENARIAAAWDGLANGTVAARIGNRLASWAGYLHIAALYRWLTREPDPDVIVIGLAETRTVGPLLRAIDWFVRLVAPHWHASRLKRELDRVVSLGGRLGETRPGKRLSRLLSPPTEPNSDEEAE